MRKVSNSLQYDFIGCDYSEQLDYFRRNIAKYKSMSSTKLRYYTHLKDMVLITYSKLDTASRESFVWDIKNKLARLRDARDVMFFTNIPILVLFISISVSYFSSTQSIGSVFSYYFYFMFLVYILYILVGVLSFLKRNTVEKQFCETILDIVLNSVC